jgi:hypothetical protein
VSRAFALIACSQEAAQAFSELGACVTSMAAEMTANPDVHETRKSEFFKKVLVAQRAIRKELEVA